MGSDWGVWRCAPVEDVALPKHHALCQVPLDTGPTLCLAALAGQGNMQLKGY